ncbi:hypothetical protein BofuT4_uP120320.1 [Botrytis cinerea T4]|uniref:Uncharacterized protein n=1 Tax=Botryotinia fuckeliana (strain T4) TaxID=999810 RepID=G2XXY9_BOTF4|nr:hypothetical protein BofuT4_uP120320.1 [Botrytis cinerea T4]
MFPFSRASLFLFRYSTMNSGDLGLKLPNPTKRQVRMGLPTCTHGSL